MTVFFNNVYSIRAIRVGSGDDIIITREATGITTCAGTGAFDGFC
jgi:hypothetical protein